MRWALLTAVAFSLSGGQPVPHSAPLGAEALAKAAVPVVVELFTSEGCSSCPPADQLLIKLAKEQPVEGVQIIPLGMHVTYWDQLGWKDPASLKGATERQQEYSRHFGEDRIYTPQAVIDGREELVGSDEAGVKRAIARAAKQPHLKMQLSASLKPDGIYATTTVENVPPHGQEPFRTVMIVTEDAMTSVVKRGENRGRTLHHDAVVRRITIDNQVLGQVPEHWRRDRLHLIAIFQGEKTGRIYAAATVPLK
jgi:hypothetical protein